MVRIIGNFQLAIFGVLLLITQNGFAGGSIAGKVTIVKGQVFIVRGSEKIQVVKDISVLESDVIESQPGGTARITMIDSNLVDVYPKSKVQIAKYIYKPNQNQKDVELKVDFGKIKSTVNQKYDGANNKFQVKTPSAVAGVRGTVFTAEYNAATKISRVVTIEGLVAVTKILDRERQAPPVFVRPDQVVKVDAEQASQEKPRDLKSEEREQGKKEDKDLGYQYDPKKEVVPADGNTTSIKSKDNEGHAAIETVKNVPSVPETIKEVVSIKEAPPVKQVDHVKDSTKNTAVPKFFGNAITTIKDVSSDRENAAAAAQTAKQKQLDDELAKKQKLLEEELKKREEEIKKRAEEESQKKAELGRRLSEIAKHADAANRLPSGTIASPNIIPGK
jgi:hypothetical protein